ncbi:DUF6624 domain-containing protein [Nonlabens sp.]|uniref:DUF6624 domain-containing protein n=1 Tax=Nonlabens sp. TaxID=1888209 RepID=UPI003F6A37F7
MNKYILLLICSILLISCKEEEKLTRINYEEMTDLIMANNFTMPEDVKYYDLNNQLLSEEEKEALSNDLPYANWFINDKNVLRKVVFQDPEVARVALKKEPVFKDINTIDCSNLNRVLERIYDRDQDNRGDNLIDQELDLSNMAAIEQILDKCGMPSIETAGEKGMSAIWLVIQHAGTEKRTKYFPMLLEASKKGDIERQEIALMQDRMLMESGEPQLYGSQLFMNADGSYELHEIKEPSKVDARRAIMGLGPLSEYVQHWGLSFDVEQVEN